MSYNKYLTLKEFEPLTDKLEIFHNLFNVDYKERDIYIKDQLTVGFSNIALNYIIEKLKKNWFFFFDCYISFKLNDNFSYKETYSIELPSDLVTKKNEIQQSEINQFIAKVLSYVFMQYGYYSKSCKASYEIYLCENNQFYNLKNIIENKLFSATNFSVYKFTHTGREYFRAGNSNEDPIGFAITKYYLKYNDVFVKDDYLDSIITKYNSGSSNGSRMGEEKKLSFDKEMTIMFNAAYNLNEHLNSLK